MARVTGIGGIFLRARDPKALAGWYARHLGLPMESWNGANLLWSDEVPAGTGSTVLAFFPPDTASGPAQAIINLRVDDLDALLAQLTSAGVPVDPKRDDAPFGRFAWITDPEGNRVELYQPLVEPEAPSQP